MWYGVGGGTVTLRSVEEDICRSGAPAPLFHARATAAGATDWVSVESTMETRLLFCSPGFFIAWLRWRANGTNWRQRGKRPGSAKRKPQADPALPNLNPASVPHARSLWFGFFPPDSCPLVSNAALCTFFIVPFGSSYK